MPETMTGVRESLQASLQALKEQDPKLAARLEAVVGTVQVNEKKIWLKTLLGASLTADFSKAAAELVVAVAAGKLDLAASSVTECESLAVKLDEESRKRSFVVT